MIRAHRNKGTKATRAKAEEPGGALVDGVAWGKSHVTGRPYPPIGPTEFGSKWTVSHLRPIWWFIGRPATQWVDPAHSHLEASSMNCIKLVVQLL